METGRLDEGKIGGMSDDLDGRCLFLLIGFMDCDSWVVIVFFAEERLDVAFVPFWPWTGLVCLNFMYL